MFKTFYTYFLVANLKNSLNVFKFKGIKDLLKTVVDKMETLNQMVPITIFQEN